MLLPRLTHLAERVANCTATWAEVRDLSRRDAIAVRTDPDLVYTRILRTAAPMALGEPFAPSNTRAAKGDDRQVSYLMSTEAALGMFKDVIKVSGWALGNFRKRGGPFLYNHNQSFSHSGLPLGRMDRVRKTTARGMRALVGDAQFAEGSAFGDHVLDLVRTGFLRGGSVGFRPLESREAKSKAEAIELGLGPLSLIFTVRVRPRHVGIPSTRAWFLLNGISRPSRPSWRPLARRPTPTA